MKKSQFIIRTIQNQRFINVAMCATYNYKSVLKNNYFGKLRNEETKILRSVFHESRILDREQKKDYLYLTKKLTNKQITK